MFLGNTIEFAHVTLRLVPEILDPIDWKDRKTVAKDLKQIYQATDDQAAEKALADFEDKWGGKYPSIAPAWHRAWQEVIPFFAFPLAVRKIIYTTNAIESLNRVIRKTTKIRGSFPTDDAAMKLIYRERPLQRSAISAQATAANNFFDLIDSIEQIKIFGILDRYFPSILVLG